MASISETAKRLQAAGGLAEVLDAAYEAFEEMLPVIRARKDPAGDRFLAFVTAGACAADGRDAVLFAPSLPPRPLTPPAGGADPGDRDRVACDVPEQFRAGAQDGDVVRAMLADNAPQGLDWVVISPAGGCGGPGRQGAPGRLLLGDVLVGPRFEFTLGPTRCVLAGGGSRLSQSAAEGIEVRRRSSSGPKSRRV